MGLYETYERKFVMSHFDTPCESHPCESPGCNATVPYDDEPYCFTHSPDSGSTVPGYSYHDKHCK